MNLREEIENMAPRTGRTLIKELVDRIEKEKQEYASQREEALLREVKEKMLAAPRAIGAIALSKNLFIKVISLIAQSRGINLTDHER